MNAVRIAAIALLVAGVIGLAVGSFSYTKTDTVAKLGPVQITANQKHTVNIPMWAGIGAIVVGGLLLVSGGRKS